MIPAGGAVRAGGWALIVAAALFMAVFAYLASAFNYPDVLDGQAADVLPRLLALGPTGRAVWALYGMIPLLLIPASLGAYAAMAPRAPATMRLAVVFAVMAAGAMMAGLLRWPSIQWTLATHYVSANAEEQRAIASVFDGLNTFLGNYLGEFVGELGLNLFFLCTALAAHKSDLLPRWIGVAGVAAAATGLVAMWRNVTPLAAGIADIENYVLPAWMLTFGVALARAGSGRQTRSATPRASTAVLLVLLATATMPASVGAQDTSATGGVHGAVFLGYGSFPAYPGAASQQAIPYIGGRIQAGRRYLAVEGVTARVNLLGSQHLEFGPALNLTFGRSASELTTPLGTLTPIDLAIEFGGFAAMAWTSVARPGDEVRIGAMGVRGINGVHEGWQGLIAAGYTTPVGGHLRVGVDASFGLASNAYASTYFSVDSAAAPAAGLPVYSASGGALDVGGSVTAIYALTRRWLAAGFVGYRRLLGDAADSPITREVGSPNQLSLGFGIGYAF